MALPCAASDDSVQSVHNSLAKNRLTLETRPALKEVRHGALYKVKHQKERALSDL